MSQASASKIHTGDDGKVAIASCNLKMETGPKNTAKEGSSLQKPHLVHRLQNLSSPAMKEGKKSLFTESSQNMSKPALMFLFIICLLQPNFY